MNCQICNRPLEEGLTHRDFRDCLLNIKQDLSDLTKRIDAVWAYTSTQNLFGGDSHDEYAASKNRRRGLE